MSNQQLKVYLVIEFNWDYEVNLEILHVQQVMPIQCQKWAPWAWEGSGLCIS